MARRGRRPEDLGLRPQPTSPAAEPFHQLSEEEAASARKVPLAQFLRAIEEMREDGRWDWADETLTGIWDSATARGDYSLEMKRAIERIYQSRVGDWDDDFDQFIKER